MHARRWVLILAAALPGWITGWAQIDPENRQLIQLGYYQPLEGRGPLAGYAFYYRNIPGFLRTNLTLRLAVAPVYLDTELGFREALGPGTDLAIGLAGGGFADSYAEIRRGHYFREESFLGHGGEISASLYQRLAPAARIPLNLIVRTSAHYATFQRDSQTRADFVLPPDQIDFRLRTGLRWGGQEPALYPPEGLELSGWYEVQVRSESGGYGLGMDRRIEPMAHLFWTRALLSHTLSDWGNYFSVSMTAGTSVNTDRLSAFRLGGVLPLISEFPLNIPGYYYQELSARRFILWNAMYELPLDSAQRFNFELFGATGLMDYPAGLAQPGHWHSGLGAGLTYRSTAHGFLMTVGYGYGFDAMRTGGRGANSIGVVCQFDLEAHKRDQGVPSRPLVSPHKSRGLDWLFRR